MAQKQLHVKNMHVDYSVTNQNSANLSENEILVELNYSWKKLNQTSHFCVADATQYMYM